MTPALRLRTEVVGAPASERELLGLTWWVANIGTQCGIRDPGLVIVVCLPHHPVPPPDWGIVVGRVMFQDSDSHQHRLLTRVATRPCIRLHHILSCSGPRVFRFRLQPPVS